MSSVTCNAAIATIHEDEEDGGDIEELNRPDDGQGLLRWVLPMALAPWPHGHGQDLLRARSREAPAPASELDLWLEARDPGPSDLVLLRCSTRRGMCNTCQYSEAELCNQTGQAGQICQACQQGDRIYCKQGGPCERWNADKTQEFHARKDFYMTLMVPQVILSQTCRGPQLPLEPAQAASSSLVQGLGSWVRNFGRPKKSTSLPPFSSTYRQTGRGRLNRTLTESVFPSSRQSVEEDQKKPLAETIFGSDLRSQDSLDVSKLQPRPYMHPFPATQPNISRRRSELQGNQSTMVEPGSYESFARVLPGRREQGTPANRIDPRHGSRQPDAVPPTRRSTRQETTVRFEDEPGHESELMSELLKGLEQLRMSRSKSTHPVRPEGNVPEDPSQSSNRAAAAEDVLDMLLPREGGNESMREHQAGAGLSIPQPQGPPPYQEEDQGDGDSSSDSEDDRGRRHRSGGGGGGGGDVGGGGDGGGGSGGGGGGWGGGGGGPGDIGRRRDRDRRRQYRGNEPDVSIPLGLIVDRLASMDARMSGDKTKQKPINLPSPTREPDGKITTISFYKWMHLLSRMVDDLSLDHSNVQIQLASDTKILPPQLREIVYDSSSLSQALRRLQSRFPPLSSTWPILISELTSKAPTGGQHTEVIDRCADLLSSISALQSLHPRRDLNREETLAALASLGSTTELQSGMVRLVREFDYAKNLHQDDPGYSTYVSNLKKYLEEERETRQDILASVALGVRMAPDWSSNIQSFASQAKPVVPPQTKRNRRPLTGHKRNNDGQSGDNDGGPEQKKQDRSPPGPPGTTTNNQKNSRAAKTCSLCQKGTHHPFQCSKIKDIQSKKMPKPDNLCLLCCHWTKTDVPHQPNCFLKSFINKDGVTKRLNLLCSTHQSTHYALCGSCDAGEITKPRVADSPTIQGFQVQMDKTNFRTSLGSPNEIPQVVFMSEVLTIQGKDGNTSRVIAHYDSLSGANFSSDIPENFNWGEKGALTEPFSLSTMTGKEEYTLPVISLKIQGRGKKPIEASFLVNNYPEIEDSFVFPDLLKECGVNSLSQEERQIPLRIMFGVPNSQNFPVSLPISRKLASRFPSLSLHQSRISGAKLVSGRISPVNPMRGIHSFMGRLSTSVHQPTSRKKKEEGSKCLVNQD